MRVAFIKYKNSVLATILSGLGMAMVLCGLAMGNQGAGEDGVLAVCIFGGFGLMLLAYFISTNKAFKTWWKQVTDAKLDEKMKTSVEVASMVYSKNPSWRTLREIKKLNPEAAEIIQQQKKNNKKTNKKK